MSVWNLSTCPVCGRQHDEGEFYKIRKSTYFVCLDCSELMTDSEVKNSIIERIENEKKDKKLTEEMLKQ